MVRSDRGARLPTTVLPLAVGDRGERHVAGLLLRDLYRNANEVFQKYATTILPVAFLARFDEDDGVAAVWQSVWDEGNASESAALRVYADELVDVVVAGLGSQHWARKAAAGQVGLLGLAMIQPMAASA